MQFYTLKLINLMKTASKEMCYFSSALFRIIYWIVSR